MELIGSSTFWVGLLKIIWVNILLSGDNAVVIALASRSLPHVQQKFAIIWGSVAAIVLRVILTIFAVQLLQLPWLKGIGAVLLIWIGVQLLGDDNETDHVKEACTLLSAIWTILIADLVMSLDNVLAVAAAAESADSEAKAPLVIFGLALSIPIVIFGSGVMLKLMERFPLIITLGAMLLGWIAGEMLAREEFVEIGLNGIGMPHLVLAVVGALLVIGIGRLKSRFARGS